jgi:maleamate amidohydrolase
MSLSREANYKGVFDGALGFGQRPAVLVIDFVKAYTTVGAPFFGEGVVAAVAASRPLLDAARRARVPVIYTKVAFHPSTIDGGLFIKKIPALRTFVQGAPLGDIDATITPEAGDLVLVKNYASCFFGTSLGSTLTALGVDTLILTGCSTSGCVRATAVDGIQYGFRVIVPRECVGDRHPAPHDAALFDINAKYGDVVGAADVIGYLDGLAGMAAR